MKNTIHYNFGYSMGVLPIMHPRRVQLTTGAHLESATREPVSLRVLCESVTRALGWSQRLVRVGEAEKPGACWDKVPPPPPPPPFQLIQCVRITENAYKRIRKAIVSGLSLEHVQIHCWSARPTTKSNVWRFEIDVTESPCSDVPQFRQSLESFWDGSEAPLLDSVVSMVVPFRHTIMGFIDTDTGFLIEVADYDHDYLKARRVGEAKKPGPGDDEKLILIPLPRIPPPPPVPPPPPPLPMTVPRSWCL